MLFDDNIGFITYNFDNFNNFNKYNKFNSTPDITSVEEGYNRGNMFNRVYDPYKNYRYPKLMPKNQREELLTDIMALSFAINDLGLYLDLHPEDKEMLAKFHDYVEKSCQKEMEYVKTYGPLELIDSKSETKFNWIDNPWPWDNDGGVKYV